jgi:alpha-tubulin suppressor-like RCC1 family protein
MSLGLLCAALVPADSSYALDAGGWGVNRVGELGGGYEGNIGRTPGPVSVVGLHEIKQVAASYFFSLALLNDGTVRAWGGNIFGELGNGSHQNSSTPLPVKGLSGVTAIAAGGAHDMALLSNGTVMTWGANTYGTLGNGTTGGGHEGPFGSTVPIQVPGLSGVVAIAAGGANDAALLKNGTVATWGENKDGQLGDGTMVEKSRPTLVRGLSGVKQIAVGGVSSFGGHMLALLNSGTVMAWGENLAGQLGDGSRSASSSVPVAVKGLGGVAAVSADVSHSLALISGGTLRSWGSNANGQLGAGSREVCPSFATKAPCSRVPLSVPGLTSVLAISAGLRFSLALSVGKVLAWGWNEFGQLGDHSRVDRSVPTPVSELGEVSAISAGEFHSLALLRGSAPPPEVEIAPGAGSLTINWRSSATRSGWLVDWRKPTSPFRKAVSLPASARSYTITGLSSVPYEVRVRNGEFGWRVIVGTPLAGMHGPVPPAPGHPRPRRHAK